MNLIPLTSNAYHLQGGSNAGLIVHDGRAVLVDTGLDKDTAKKILRHVDSLGVTLAAVAITHAHADHFGGAATVKARTGAPVYAPAFEAAMVEHPLFEPLYLFSGAMPPADLLHKFTLADACAVDGLLAPGDVTLHGVPVRIIAASGHAPNQVMVASVAHASVASSAGVASGAGLASGEVVFVADAIFAPDILQKHGIPFMVDVDAWLTTLAGLPSLDGQYAAFVPGHGPAVSSITGWAGENAARLAAIRAAVDHALDETGDPGEIVRRTANALGLTITVPVTYWLTQTAVFACLTSLQRAGQARPIVEANALHWRRA
jgi:glyoxylase-like metal-dependent hydrolase (beta-lactamase superfamily II)